MKSWVVWIWRRSWEEMGGARVWRMLVKVGRARERSSPPARIDVSRRVEGLRVGERTQAPECADVAFYLLRPPLGFLVFLNLFCEGFGLFDGCGGCGKDPSPPPSSTA